MVKGARLTIVGHPKRPRRVSGGSPADQPGAGAKKRAVLSREDFEERVTLSPESFSVSTRGHGHGLYTTVIEEIYIAIGIDRFCRRLWEQMKTDIDLAFDADPRAGGTVFLEKLKKAWTELPNLRVTLIGHSAGAIYVQRFIEALDQSFGSRSQQTVEVITLAAAMSFERMVQGLAPLQRRLSAVRVFGLSDRREGGYWEVPFIYDKLS